MKRWLALLCLTVLLIALFATGSAISVASEDVTLGDLDGDGIISMKDVLILRRYIAHAGDLADTSPADVNGDNSVDMRDVLLIRKRVARLIDAFPAGGSDAPLPDLSAKVPFFRYEHDHLSADEKDAYTDMVEEVEAHLAEETTAHDGAMGLTVYFSKELPDETAAARVFRSVYADHPEFYYLCNHYSYIHTPEGRVTALLLHYYMNAAERERAGEELLSVVNRWVEDLPPDASDADKEITLHDRLCDAVTYASGNGPYPDDCYSPYGALVNGTAICDGYARALQLLLFATGIKSTVVEGFDANGATHMWNVVYLAGDPYYVDATWDDTTLRPAHAYCNITTSDIASSHTMNFWFPIPPTCTATRYNYYRSRGLFITSTDGSDYARQLAAARVSGDKCFEARFSIGAMSANRRITESGHLCDLVNERLPSGVDPISGYAYSFYEGINVIFLAY